MAAQDPKEIIKLLDGIPLFRGLNEKEKKSLADLKAIVVKGNKVVRSWGKARKLSFKGKDHLELGESLGWFSMKSGSKVTGSNFPVYTDFGARLERGLINFMLDFQTKKNNYKEIWPPALVNEASMIGTGQLGPCN